MNGERTRALGAGLLGCAMLLAAACAAPQKPEPPATVGADIRHGVEDPRVLELWQDAEVARQTRDFSRATVRLEQAVQIEPGNPVLWSRLAELLLLQNESARAENLAAKSNALAPDQPALRFRNWLIISYAREARGDTEGAELARRRTERLRGAGTADPGPE